MAIALSSPYPYYGGNLWIYFEETQYTEYPGSEEMTWYGKTQTDYTAVFQNNGYGAAQFLPKITLGYTPAPSCVQPTALTVGEVTNWHVYYSTDPTASADDISLDEVIAVSTTPTYTFTGLDASTKYYFWVRGNCDINDYSSWAGSDFTTDIACSAPTRLNVSNSYDITELTADKDYAVRVRKICGGGDGVSTWQRHRLQRTSWQRLARAHSAWCRIRTGKTP